MKKLLCCLVVAFLAAGCGVTYHSQSGGKADEAYIKVLREGGAYPQVVLEVDGKEYPLSKIYQSKDYQKASSVAVTPGKHQVKVKSSGRVIAEESIFIGVQETRKIILRK